MPAVQKKKSKPSSSRRPARRLDTASQRKKSRIQIANERTIINAAIVEFSKHGYRGATLDEIAARAKLSKPNLLYYFKTKKTLYVESLNHVLDIWLSPLESLNPEDDPKQALGAYIEKKMELSRDNPDASRMFAMEIIKGAKVVKPVLEGRLAELTKRKRNVLAKWAREGTIAKIDGVHLLFMIWSVTQHYADFEAQVKSQTGQTLKDKSFFKITTDTIKQIIFHGVLR